jgi:hypothetical protein
LERYTGSLRSLELSHIYLEEDTTENPDRQHGSWIRFIHFLERKLSLEHSGFNGNFSNSWNEAWVTRDADDKWLPEGSKTPLSYTADCLKYRIERFVTHGGLSPFTARTILDEDDDEDSLPHDLPWNFAEDSSWKFEPRLLQ